MRSRPVRVTDPGRAVLRLAREVDLLAADAARELSSRDGDRVVLPVAVRGTLRPRRTWRRPRPMIDVVVGDPFTLDVGKGRAGLVRATDRLRETLAALVRAVDDERARRDREN